MSSSGERKKSVGKTNFESTGSSGDGDGDGGVGGDSHSILTV